MTVYFPDAEGLERLAGEFNAIPVHRRVVTDLETPVSAFLKLSGSGPAFLLESVEHGDRWGRYSFVGIDPHLVLVSRNGVVAAEGDAPPGVLEAPSPLEAVREAIERFRSPAMPGLPPFHSGAVGYLGYDVVRYLEKLPQTTIDDVGVPELVLMFPRTVIAFDHLKQEASVVVTVAGPGDYDRAVQRGDEIVARLGEPLAHSTLDPVSDVESALPPSTMGRERFESGVEKAKDYIMAGDAFQIVLSHRFSRDLRADPFDVYRALRLINPSPYMFFLRHPEVTVLGSSPEPLVKVRGRQVVQRPIAGTLPRGSTEDEDRALEEEFLRDEKERAEHVMLVDLARNDLGRVSRFGSVKVEELMTVERYSHVMHLVSQVSGELREDCSAIDALYASFPAGTVSGAPKIRAMEIIAELEPDRRGPYAGAVGYFDLSGNLDTCITLRTMTMKDGVAHVQAGGGIVYD
ncbi:MAG: anthranilate synthase component I, partial [Actinomycetota bacterium]